MPASPVPPAPEAESLVGAEGAWASGGFWKTGDFLFFYFAFLVFSAAPMAYARSQTKGSNPSYSCRPTPQPQPLGILGPIFDLHYSLKPCWILNPLSKPRDQTCILMDSSRVRNPLSHSEDP